MSYRRHSMLALAGLLSVGLFTGCNYKGEEPVKEADFATSSQVKTAIGAAGSTFVSPIMIRWISTYQQGHPATQINYRAIGSAAGLNELRQGTLEIAASDAPLNDKQLKDMAAIIQVPVAAGPVCAVYNLPGLKSPLRLSGPTLARIFLGKIISWQDPAIARENPGAQLPHAAIIVVHRSDGSGTTSILSTYLAKVSPEWSQTAGQGLSIKWPVGIGAQGSNGVLDFVSQNVGTIGYAELNYAKERHLPVASIQNRAGNFVVPSPATATAAIESFNEALSKDMRASVVDPPVSAKEAYPITGLTFFMVAKDGVNSAERQAIRDFIQYTVSGGQDLAEGLDYAKLPKSIQDRALGLLGEMQSNGQPIKST
ncbi:MAG TPA: phosphate ABC transporter substrate-binding protein PstS [Candidatus Acidoferrum sp.]|nr:phosphate ABC transporter substrate-binding protein PstS [Candidatus Acidoferrum sp.]